MPWRCNITIILRHPGGKKKKGRRLWFGMILFFFFSIPPRLPSVVSCPGIYNISDEDKKQTKEECLVLLQQSLIFFLPLIFSTITTTTTTTPHMKKKKTRSFVVVSFSSAALRRALVTKLCQTSRWRWKPVQRDARHYHTFTCPSFSMLLKISTYFLELNLKFQFDLGFWNDDSFDAFSF